LARTNEVDATPADREQLPELDRFYRMLGNAVVDAAVNQLSVTMNIELQEYGSEPPCAFLILAHIIRYQAGIG